jgi:zinc transport system ATP-binding protein
MKAPLVSIKNMDVGYQNQLVLSDVSLDVFERDFIGIIGPNGGGKTTLIKAILGLLKPPERIGGTRP